jgi:hypothetical protein
MIQLSNDCLVFQLSNGESIPCSVERFTIELIGEAVAGIDSELIRNAAHAVLHHFRHDLKRSTVTLAEFSEALEKVLRSLGLNVTTTASAGGMAETSPAPSEESPAAALLPDEETDLAQLAAQAEGTFELDFFPRLRELMRESLQRSPRYMRFTGLRPCAKRLVGARRWSQRCTDMSDQIVDFLRECLNAETPAEQCALVVQ